MLQVLLAQLHKGSAAPDGGLHLAADALRSQMCIRDRAGNYALRFALSMYVLELTDGFPSKPAAYFRRLHRWVRGDWQNISFILRRGRNFAFADVYKRQYSSRPSQWLSPV